MKKRLKSSKRESSSLCPTGRRNNPDSSSITKMSTAPEQVNTVYSMTVAHWVKQFIESYTYREVGNVLPSL